nr:MFS transporter [Parasynechococcus marenigrum]
MTPLVFHAIAFSASQVGRGLAVSALVGTVVRLLSGALLDRGLRCSWPIRATTLLAISADLMLFQADTFSAYVLGQTLLGTAAGLYWPAIELAVPLNCGDLPSGRGYALVRSADALGIGMGAFMGTIAASIGQLRLVYGVEAICMASVLILISVQPLLDERPMPQGTHSESSTGKLDLTWLPPLLPVLVVSVVATGILSLQQSALPLDLVKGGLERPGLSESHSSALIAFQLTLLVLLQWPVGRWLSERSVGFGLSLSLVSFATGCTLIGLSALTASGTGLVMVALLPMAFAQAAFLPTATEAVVEETPPEHRGLAMAMFSQCFALSAMAAPVVGGNLLDQQGHGLTLWIGVAAISLAVLPLVKGLRPRFLGGVQGRTNNLSMLKQGVQAASGSKERPVSSNNR